MDTWILIGQLIGEEERRAGRVSEWKEVRRKGLGKIGEGKREKGIERGFGRRVSELRG